VILALCAVSIAGFGSRGWADNATIAQPADPKVALITPLLSDAVKKAGALIDHGQVKEGYEALQRAAAAKDASAEYVLGYSLMRGLRQAAANAGSPNALAAAAPTAEDRAQATEYVFAAAIDGFSAAQAEIGFGFEYGTAYPRNYQLALHLYDLAAKQNFPCGMRGVARMKSSLGKWAAGTESPAERDGDDALMRRDYPAALAAYMKAADADSAYGMFEVGFMHARGIAVPRDPNESLHWYERAAQQAYPPAEFEISLRHGMQFTPEDVVWLKKAADHGDTVAIVQMAIAIGTGQYGVAKDEDESLAMIEKAASLEDTVAKQMLAQAYFFGEPGRLEQDRGKAIRLATEAYEDGNPHAGELLGQLLRKLQSP
jgi:TPR repeat protein